MRSEWSRRIACNFRDGTEDELIRQRAGKLTPADYALLDAIYFAAAGLAEGYALLGKHGWIDEDKRAFHPVVETLIKLQREMKDDLARLGLDAMPKIVSPYEDFLAEQEAEDDRRLAERLVCPPAAAAAPPADDPRASQEMTRPAGDDASNASVGNRPDTPAGEGESSP
jgi:hypothetical protein